MQPNSNVESAPSRQYYRPELDWVRFLAFALVFLVHAFPDKPEKYTKLGMPKALAEQFIAPFVGAGGYGVDLFFALSSFLITTLLLKEKESSGRVHVKAFYVRRVLRIWPLYVAFIFAVWPYEYFIKNIPLLYHISLLTFAGNWYVVFVGRTPSLCDKLWSVCIEEQFYLAWPNILGRSTIMRFIAILVGLLFATNVYRYFYVSGTPPFPYSVWFNTFARLDSFAMGGVLACVLHNRHFVLPYLVRALLLVLGLGIYWYIGLSPYGGYFGPLPVWTYPLAALASVILITSFVSAPMRSTLTKPQQALSYLGKISYGLYVFHGPAIRLAERVFGREWPSQDSSWVFRMFVAVLLTLLVSTLSYELLEKPFLRMKRRFTFVNSRPD